MNKKKFIIAGIILIVALVSCDVFFGIRSSNKLKNKEKKLESYILAQITISAGNEDEMISYEDLHVSENEKEIFISGYRSKVSQSEISGDTIDMEILEEETVLFKALKENSKFSDVKEIDMGEYTASKFLWDGDDFYFIGSNNNASSGNGDVSDLGECELYHAEIEDFGIKNVHQIELDNTIKITDYRQAAIHKGKIIFYGFNGESTSYYTGNVKDGKLSDVKDIGDCSENDVIQSLRFSDDGDELFLSAIYIDTDSGFRQGHEIIDLSRQGFDNRQEVEVKNDVISVENIHFFDINAKKHIFYYGDEKDSENADMKITIYKTEYGKTLHNLFDDSKEGGDVQVKKEYNSGDYSYDQYDKGEFESVKRNKSDISEKQGVWYEIFVRSFADSDGDGIGDFNGIRQKLDYLSNLGIDGIWLMPVNESPSYHGYDITDYMKLNNEYGTEEDFANLIKEAHAKGIKIIMDFPINHTSMDHPWFASASSDINSEYRNYYRWVHENDSTDYSKNDESNWGSSVWHKVGNSYYYGMFGMEMPDLNYNNPKVREEIKSAAGKWLEMGIDGFRLDAAMHIYGANEFKQEENPTESTIQWWNEFAVYCEQINPKVYLVGEAWNNDEVLEEYVQPFDTKFNFAFEEKLMAAVVNGTAMTDSNENLSGVLQDILDKYVGVDENYLDGVFGTNHDQNRIMSQVETESKARLIANIYMTLSGNPYIYYGEELGMYGSKPDEKIRTPFKWSNGGQDLAFNTKWIEDDQNTELKAADEQITDDNSMFNLYKNLIALRKANTALSEGKYTGADLNNNALMTYVRESSGQKLLIIHNLSGNTQNADISRYNVKEVAYNSVMGNNEVSGLEGSSINLNAESSIILEIE